MAGEPLRLALCGGGPGSFIGPVHRRAAQLDGRYVLVSGMFSRNRERAHARAEEWGIDPARSYGDIESLISGEAARVDGAQVVAIATSNDSHAAIASAALRAGLHVFCEKPMTTTIGDAYALARTARGSRIRFGLAYTYAGYAMIREARARVIAGRIGTVRKVMVDYQQGWLADPVETDNAQAAWRTDPLVAGAGGCIGDIGVHAFQVAEMVSGLRVRRLCADLSAVVPGRALDDDCNVLLRFDGDVPGILTASQVATGEGNDLTIRIYGEHCALIWSHSCPGVLRMLHKDGREERTAAGTAVVGRQAAHATRLPFGHPEGFIEALANLYGDLADAITDEPCIGETTLPGAEEGLRSMMFIEAAIASHRTRAWTELPEVDA